MALEEHLLMVQYLYIYIYNRYIYIYSAIYIYMALQVQYLCMALDGTIFNVTHVEYL